MQGIAAVRFLIVGHGELESELRSMPRSRRGGHRAFLGLRHDIARILRSSDLFCFTSLAKAFRTSCLKRCAGLPIVTPVFPALTRLLTREHGLVVRSGDDKAVGDAIREVIDRPDLARRMGDRAREKAANCFSMEAMVRNTLAYYRAILDGRS